MAHFLSRVIDRGTASKSADEIAELLDGRGVTLAATAMRHAFTVSCTCLAEDFPAMLALVADVVRNPSLPEHEIATRRGEIVTGIRQDQDNPAVVAVEEELALLYPGRPPVRPAREGHDRARSSGSTAARWSGAHHDRFSPPELVVVCVGDVEAARVVEESDRVFGDWTGYPPPPGLVPAPPPVDGRRQVVFPMMNKAQADIAYGFITIARRDPSYYAFSLMNNVLGQYALGGRLGDSIRERQGMAYYVFSAFEPNVGQGPLVIRAGVNPANVDRAIASIDEEVRKMAADGLTADELADVEALPRRLDAADARDERRHRGLPAHVRAVRPRHGLRPAAARPAERRHPRARPTSWRAGSWCPSGRRSPSPGPTRAPEPHEAAP